MEQSEVKFETHIWGIFVEQFIKFQTACDSKKKMSNSGQKFGQLGGICVCTFTLDLVWTKVIFWVIKVIFFSVLVLKVL